MGLIFLQICNRHWQLEGFRIECLRLGDRPERVWADLYTLSTNCITVLLTAIITKNGY